MTNPSVTPVPYRNIYFYPPLALGADNGATVMQLFQKLKENEKNLTSEKIYREIAAKTESKSVYTALAFNERLHDSKIHAQFPVVWDLEKSNQTLPDIEKRAVALSPVLTKKDFVNLWLSPSTVVVGHQLDECGCCQKPFMVMAMKAQPSTDPKIAFYPEQIAENFLDIGFQPAIDKFIPGLLYHKSVHHLKKLCTLNH